MTLREQKKLASWHNIQNAALRLFSERGYEATTIELIAEAANISRATFFNYFASKEAVVFDQDPSARGTWQASMAARSDAEPLWDALTAILLEFVEALRDRMPLQRQLKAASPALAQSTQGFGEQFRRDVETWVAARPQTTADDISAPLQVNLAFAALTTAYQTWRADEPFDDFVSRVRRSLELATPQRRL